AFCVSSGICARRMAFVMILFRWNNFLSASLTGIRGRLAAAIETGGSISFRIKPMLMLGSG
uniref:hypothetical protein n=1 Tax=uncultured Rhizobium sp. TaxID=155567 RepID=UPI002623B6A7